MQPPKSNICVICASRIATTAEHVPPRGFFKGLAPQLITVPACVECNNGSSQDDEALRFYLSMQVGQGTPESAALWNLGARKSVMRKSPLQRQVLENTKEVLNVDTRGNVVPRIAMSVPARTYQTVFEKTTRGLYFFHTGRILQPTTPVDVWPQATPPDLNRADFSLFQANSIAGNVFVYLYGIVHDDPESSLWLFGFHQTNWVTVATGNAIE